MEMNFANVGKWRKKNSFILRDKRVKGVRLPTAHEVPATVAFFRIWRGSREAFIA